MSERFAVVTGGTRGIGAAIVARLRADGFHVLAVARHAPADRICDVTEATAVRALFGSLPRVDALVNCAGSAGANALDGDDALWHAIINSNLHGTYHCCKAALPLLPDTTGRIVNIASVLGLRGVPDQTAYCAAKHGVVGFTRALALALAPRGITVNAICPGWVETDMARQRFAELGMTAEQAAAGIPTRHVTTPEEVADLVAWLLRPETRNITGQALPIDGGDWRCRNICGGTLMAEPRLKAGLWVKMALRMADLGGNSGAVLRRGDADSGGVLVVLRGREGLCVLSQVRAADGALAWMRATGAAPVEQEAVDTYVARQVKFDPDVWVVEFEAPDLRPPFEAKIV